MDYTRPQNAIDYPLDVGGRSKENHQEYNNDEQGQAIQTNERETEKVNETFSDNSCPP